MASNLIRTQQTIGVIMKMLDRVNNIYIVPCAHELNYVSEYCDGHLFQKIPILSNIPKCIDNTNSCNLLTNFSKVNRYNNYNVDINWDYYMNNNIDCINTNMMYQIINLYNSLNK